MSSMQCSMIHVYYMYTVSVVSSDMEYVGKKAKDYCEIASRTSPTLSDVELALVDAGELPGTCHMFMYNTVHVLA